MNDSTIRLVTLGLVLSLGIGGALGAFSLGAEELATAVLALCGGILIPLPRSAS